MQCEGEEGGEGGREGVGELSGGDGGMEGEEGEVQMVGEVGHVGGEGEEDGRTSTAAESRGDESGRTGEDSAVSNTRVTAFSPNVKPLDWEEPSTVPIPDASTLARSVTPLPSSASFLSSAGGGCDDSFVRGCVPPSGSEALC